MSARQLCYVNRPTGSFSKKSTHVMALLPIGRMMADDAVLNVWQMRVRVCASGSSIDCCHGETLLLFVKRGQTSTDGNYPAWRHNKNANVVLASQKDPPHSWHCVVLRLSVCLLACFLKDHARLHTRRLPHSLSGRARQTVCFGKTHRLRLLRNLNQRTRMLFL